MSLHICNPGLKGANWTSLVADRFDCILTASGPKQFEKKFNRLWVNCTQAIPPNIGYFRTCTKVGASLAGIEPGDVLLKINAEPIRPPVQPVINALAVTTGAKPTSHY